MAWYYKRGWIDTAQLYLVRWGEMWSEADEYFKLTERRAFVARQLAGHCSSVTGYGASIISLSHLSCECPVMDRSPARTWLLYCRCLAVYNWKSEGKLLFNLSCRIPTLLIGLRSSWKYKLSNQSAPHWLFCIYFNFSTRQRCSIRNTVLLFWPHTLITVLWWLKGTHKIVSKYRPFDFWHNVWSTLWDFKTFFPISLFGICAVIAGSTSLWVHGRP